MFETLDQIPFSQGRSPVTINVPPNGCDAHFHIFDPVRFPYAPCDARNQPPATVSAYRLLQAKLHLDRGVVVTPSAYGADNRCTLHAIQQLGIDRTRGIITLDQAPLQDQLNQYDQAGVCGVRYNFFRGATVDLDAIRRMSECVATLDWSISFWMPASITVELEGFLSKLPSKLIFDHRGHLPQPEGLSHPAWSTLRRLIDKGGTWIKLSALYHDSKQMTQGYSDTIAVGREIAMFAPERVVWGSDWPHPSEYTARRDFPDDAFILDAVARQVGDTRRAIRRVLVDNPQKLFNFTL